MTTIDPKARFETPDFAAIEAGVVQGHRLQAHAMVSALKSLFSRETKDRAEDRDVRLPDCAAAA